jgi:hypothetical protein
MRLPGAQQAFDHAGDDLESCGPAGCLFQPQRVLGFINIDTDREDIQRKERPLGPIEPALPISKGKRAMTQVLLRTRKFH